MLPTYREINEFTPAPIPVPIPAKIRNNGVTKPIAASGLGPNPATQILSIRLLLIIRSILIIMG